MAGVARNFITNIHIGREFNMDGAVPRSGADVPRWYGETIGFWDKDTLITWTSNIQGWKVHGAFEYSNKMQTIEIYTPNRDASGKFVGLNHEAIFYDPDALVEPIRIVRNFTKIERASTRATRTSSSNACRRSSRSTARPTPVSPGTEFEYEVPDMFGRPWAPDLGEVLRAGHGEARTKRTSSTSRPLPPRVDDSRVRDRRIRARRFGRLWPNLRPRVLEDLA